MAVTRRRGRRRALPRTPDARLLEAAGLFIGRLCMRSPEVNAAITAGFTLAVRERVAGRTMSVDDILAELARSERELRAVLAPRRTR